MKYAKLQYTELNLLIVFILKVRLEVKLCVVLLHNVFCLCLELFVSWECYDSPDCCADPVLTVF